MSLTKKYISSSIVGLIGKAFNMVSMLGILWLLNVIMDKEGFGLFMIAFSLMFVIAMIIASGFQSLLLYHISRLDEENEKPRINSIAGQIFWLTAFISLAAAGLVYLLSSWIENLMGLSGLSVWINLMVLFIPAHAMALVLPTLPRALHKSEQTILYQEIVLNGLRVLFLAVIWMAALPETFAAWAYILSAIIPVLIVFYKYPVALNFKDMPLTLWDFKYVGKISMFQILNQPFRGLDVLLVGAFASAGAAADYTMATRLAQLLWIPKHAASQLQVPRMGALLDKQDHTQLMKEYDAMRSITLFMVLGACAFLLFFGQWVLSLFGNYAGAFSILLLLSAASIIRTGAGASGDIMSQSGHAGWSAIIAGLSMIITIGSCVFFVPVYGAYGAGAAVLLGTIALFVGFERVIKVKEKIETMPSSIFAITYLSSVIVCLPVFPECSPLLAGFACIILAIMLLALDRSWLRFLKDRSLI